MSMNKVILQGRLCNDPELKRTATGTAITNFTIAVDRGFKSKDGEKETDFVPIVAWRNTAEFAERFLSKGRMALVEGRLQFREWTDKDGNRRKIAEVVAENVYFCDSKNDAPKASIDALAERAETLFTSPGGGFTEIEDDSDILPF